MDYRQEQQDAKIEGASHKVHIPAQDLVVIKEAARLMGLTLEAFILDAARQRALYVIDERKGGYTNE